MRRWLFPGARADSHPEDNSLFRPPVSAGVALTPPLPNFGERLRAADLLIAKAPEDCAASRIAAAAVAEARTPAFGARNTSAYHAKLLQQIQFHRAVRRSGRRKR